MPNFSQRLAGGFWGLLVGDALGVPYEFHAPASIPSLKSIEMEPPAGFSRAHVGTPSGTWSDDGALALCLLDSLLEKNSLDLENLAQKFALWHSEGLWAVDNRVFDVGVTTGAAIRSWKRGTQAENAGPKGSSDNGNGSLMRVLPLVLWHRGPDEELARLAMRQSLVTHGHARSQVCCALYCLWARRVLEENPAPWEAATAILREILDFEPDFLEELDFQIRPDLFEPGRGSGYVVDSLRSARWVMQENSFEGVVKAAVALGHDTDTTACIAGGVAGLRDGFGAIPARWMENLRGRDVAETLWTNLEKAVL